MLAAMIRAAALALLCWLPAAPALAAEAWRAEPADAAAYPAAIVAETRAPAPSGIAHMLADAAPWSGDVVLAWYSEPTTRYRHAVLGDGTEGGALTVRLANGRNLVWRLPKEEVFEDIAPRIADLDRDGSAEIVTILSSVAKGASVAVFGLAGDALVKKAQTPFIGTANRWLNIAAISNFAGRSTPQIALVATPHIGGTLGLFGYAPGRLVQLAAERGFSNHVLGSSELRLSAVADIDEDGKAELALPSADRTALRIVEFEAGRWKEIASVTLPAAIDKAILAEGAGRKAVFVVGLADGTVWKVGR